MSPLSVPKIFMAGGAVGFGYYLYMRQYWFPDPYKTQGVKNIEDRYSSAGGHPTHTPAVASRLGTASTSSDNDGRKEGGSNKGPDSEHFKSNHSSQQSEPVFPGKFYETHYHNPKGK
ncbi:hypothetical protein E8E12_010561 [Didymella heteroderae]|uniref:Uncharacterized protein n=1 Tax=Didymella heteroderae TaxID=1769908 RepID=A0A9P5C3I3_9PLEO|nr:hypothetical protein E8E12_010561 [Didymella heteroderae]